MKNLNLFPQYLQDLSDNVEQYYGTLSPDIDSAGNVTSWIITGDPGVTEFAKRLFPGSNAIGAGKAKFPNTKRIIENLNWLMLRYPLHIEHKDLWEHSRQEAIKHALNIIEFNKRPLQRPEPAEFIGTLKDFQKEGLSYLCGAERALLADEMGLGKTPQALAFLAAMKAYPAIIVAPSHLITNWQNEIEKFIQLPNGALGGVHVIKGLTPYSLPAANIYLIHYGLLRGWKNVLPEYEFKAAIFDEIQDLRHDNTEKYSAASLLSSSVDYCIGLSGTPIYNRGGEMWAVMNIIEYHCLGDWGSFSREWCYGYG
jgi:SWI/SNF-related matrix-associated actin-dependent regulator 1 of chromatin subfamily A